LSQIKMRDQINNHWPAGGTECVSNCPVCGSFENTPMHGDLSDLTFNVAPGTWAMVRCNDCRSGYLDPRPTAATIGLAYTNYYTHADTGENNDGGIAKFRRGIASSYANGKLGTHFAGEIMFGHVFTWFLPRLRRYLDVRYRRHLPDAHRAGNYRRLLDVGCGNGEFLACASALGWLAEGIDIDPAAVAAALTAGYSAKVTDLNDPLLKPESYDQITLSHVIEHMAAPREQLKRCLDLLSPNGRLWLQTPNIDSVGHNVFGAAWRGLEPPRHLVLFNRPALQEMLSDVGFVDIEFKAHPAVPLFIWEESRQILKRMPFLQRNGIFSRLSQMLPAAVFADYWSVMNPDSAEFLTCIAFRPNT
jgi:SAM-dependent methyltransferase